MDLPKGPDGKRQVRVLTIHGTKRDAQRELTRLVHSIDAGTYVDPSELTVAEWLTQWLAGLRLTPRIRESYDVIVGRLVKAIGTIPLQNLRPSHVHAMRFTKRDGSPVAPATERQAHRVLKAALAVAVEMELVHRNVAASGPRRAGGDEVADIPGPENIAAILAAVRDTDLFPIVHLAISTGARRGELLALRWVDVDFEARTIRIERTLEFTKSHGARFKSPKTKAGKRTVEVPISSIEVLREHRRAQLELRMRLGMGKPLGDALVFCNYKGEPLSGDRATCLWRRAVGGKWKFHSLRHAHATR